MTRFVEYSGIQSLSRESTDSRRGPEWSSGIRYWVIFFVRASIRPKTPSLSFVYQTFLRESIAMP